MAQMALPVIPVRDDVLVAPIVGNIDSLRAEQLLSSVLRRRLRGENAYNCLHRSLLCLAVKRCAWSPNVGWTAVPCPTSCAHALIPVL